MTKAQLSQAVKDGIDWLDRNIPDWFKRVNPNILDITHCQHCVLGQLFGDYSRMVDELIANPSAKDAKALSSNDRHRFGFTAGTHAERSELTRLWKEAITTFRMAA